MIKRITLQLILITTISPLLMGQNQESGIYTDSTGQVYVQASLPVYFFIAPDNKPESRIMLTSSDSQSNPMLFDGNGIHYIKTMDSETQKLVNFKIIADGIAPKISLHFKNGLIINASKRFYVEQGSRADILEKDNLSGIRSTFASIDGSEFTKTKSILFDKGHEYLVKTFAIDNVGNISDTLKINVITALDSIVKINNIYFSTNSSRLQPKSKTELDELVQVLTEFPEIMIELRAHTDCIGDADYNLKLSDKRAEAVVNYLIDKGIGKKRLVFKGFGDTNPVNECTKGVSCPDEKHQENRRVEFKILPIK